MPDNKNKVKYGFKNIHWAPATVASDGTITYGDWTKWPGAVTIGLSPQGEITPFYADNIDYFDSNGNTGYNGDVETALIPEALKEYALGEIKHTDGVAYEDTDAQLKHFALAFEFTGDVNAIRHIFYNCTMSRPGVEGQTKGGTTDPQTETTTITASSGVFTIGGEQKNIVKGRCADKTSEAYSEWYTKVHIPE